MLGNPVTSSAVEPLRYCTAFLITILIEWIVISLLLRSIEIKRTFLILGANLLTHPLAVYAWLPFAAREGYSVRDTLLYAELTIPFIEACTYGLAGWRPLSKVFIISAMANFASWTMVAVLKI